jgi:glutathione synthase/RimK-type ligase-like ATP-grasp enzyme
MTPKEKAEELIEKYLNMNDGLIQEFIPIPIEGARQCALIAVDEVLKECSWELTGFWISVKQEIENL